MICMYHFQRHRIGEWESQLARCMPQQWKATVWSTFFLTSCSLAPNTAAHINYIVGSAQEFLRADA
eukprot:4880632-Amphidinium_carterae.1